MVNRAARRGKVREPRGGFLRLAVLPALLMTACAHAQQDIEKALRSALSGSKPAHVQLGAYVVDLKTRRPVFSQNADLPLIPASAMKVLAMASALVELGQGFVFETAFATNGTDLIVVGDGDPAFGDEKVHARRGETINADFERWAEALAKRGMGTVPGDLVIDESIFEDRQVHPSWEPEDLGKWYAAPVGALNFNDNCVDIAVEPSGQAGAPVRVLVQPQAGMLKIVNTCRSGGEGQPLLHHDYGMFEYRISGRCSKRWQFTPVAFRDPGLLFADALRSALTTRNVHISGGTRRARVRLPDGNLPPSLTVIARRGTRIAEVLQRAGKDSQNLFGECLLKRAGYAWQKRHGHPDPQGSWASGQEAVGEMMAGAGIDTRGLTVVDGSGLSRGNSVTARQLAEILAWMHTRPEGPLLHGNLSVAGVDGSLRKRMNDMPAGVFAKTGTMNGVRTLAGYVQGDNGARYAFAVLYNGFKGSSAPYKESQERFCRVLAKSAKN